MGSNDSLVDDRRRPRRGGTRSTQAPTPTVATYTATYRVEYKGKEAGTAEFSVRYLADRDLYEFSSRVVAKGLLKLARPKPAVERSQFRVDGDGIRPLEFWYEDGSRSGEDNLHIVFDWERRVATVSSAEARREMAVPDAALDRGTLQVALMRDLAATGAPRTLHARRRGLRRRVRVHRQRHRDDRRRASGPSTTRVLDAAARRLVARDVALGRAGAALPARAHRAAPRRRGADRVRARQRQRLDASP